MLTHNQVLTVGRTCLAQAILIYALNSSAIAEGEIDLTETVLVVRSDSESLPERTAATVLVEEVATRTGIEWEIGTRWPESGCAIAISSGKNDTLNGRAIPQAEVLDKPEAFAIATDLTNPDLPVLWVAGADPRGALYGVGKLLRTLEWRDGSVRLPVALNVSSAPRHRIRGHQLGYRTHASSYDAWLPEQYDRYIRELALFGVNSVENIPFQDEREPVSGYPREKMNVDMSRICDRYDVDYWVWVPADFELTDTQQRTEMLDKLEGLFRDCPRMDGVFFPGGDPGDNPPELVIPYIRDMAARLNKYHPKGKIWLSLQGFSSDAQDYTLFWVADERPKWLGGITGGPSSPPLPELRSRVPKEYGLRDYPDITHSVRCQNPVPWWDPAFAYTLGRECINPRPLFFTRWYRDIAPFTDGFISYSDGCHDDVNKIICTAQAWDPDTDPLQTLTDYCRFHFGPDYAESAAAGIIALERNFEGALATNGGVDATLALWHDLETKAPELSDNWRWQMFLMRAYYDAYIRHRLIYESGLEEMANAKLLECQTIGVDEAINAALAVLQRADTERIRADLSSRVEDLCGELFQSIGLQSSVEKYKSHDPQRGAVLDFLYYPMNNRWWLEDELAKVRELPADAEKIARLEVLATWENPGPGSFYDDIGNVGQSPHVVRGQDLSAPLLDREDVSIPGFMWWDKGQRRVRQSWVSGMDWPKALVYYDIDPKADYLVRTTGNGDCLLRVNGVRLAPTVDGKEVGDIKEFPVPRRLYRDGTITLTFDPTFEPHLNWRVQSRLTEVWLIKSDQVGRINPSG
jgi:hypothetical protein